jgi:enoyl-CoA hydratase
MIVCRRVGAQARAPQRTPGCWRASGGRVFLVQALVGYISDDPSETRVAGARHERKRMGITHEIDPDGIAEVVMDNPPVNALDVAGWFQLADVVRRLGEDPQVRVVVLRAEGRGFNAGVDIKEMQRTEGHDALIGANRGCYAAFAAIYECAVPVISAVNGFCLGGGIGLVGNSDIIVAADDATFGLPEVDRGALGAATHLSRLVPQHKMRAMVYTSATATAQELQHFGSVLRVVPQAELRDAALEVARDIAAKSPVVIRAAKESLNGIDLWDVKRSYRFEQGFTFELNLSGVADQARDAFVEKRDAGFGAQATGEAS